MAVAASGGGRVQSCRAQRSPPPLLAQSLKPPSNRQLPAAPPPSRRRPPQFKPLTLSRVDELTHNTKRFVFALPEPRMRVGLPTGQHITFLAKDSDGKDVYRPYTPTTDDDTPGSVEFVIKIYEQGKMSQVRGGGLAAAAAEAAAGAAAAAAAEAIACSHPMGLAACVLQWQFNLQFAVEYLPACSSSCPPSRSSS